MENTARTNTLVATAASILLAVGGVLVPAGAASAAPATHGRFQSAAFGDHEKKSGDKKEHKKNHLEKKSTIRKKAP
ncbi:hypothetical protein GCM10020295_26380 [Streptomyces cinereospinus]